MNPLYVLIPIALVLLVVGVWLLASPTRSSGEPRLVFDETSFDFGTVPLNKMVEHDFVYRNVGDAPLVLLDKPEVELVEGC